ncbi:MAG: acetate uptake transporter family protein [Syntrophales bacterium]
MAHEHSFATPGPAGLGALAVACFGFGAVFLGKVVPEGLPLLAAWLIGGGIVQYTTAVIELKDHNITGGNVFLFFAAFFMVAAALSTFAKFMLIKFGMKPAVHVEGWMWMAGAAFLTLVTPAYAKGNLFIFLLVVLIDIVLWMIVGVDTGWYGDPAAYKPIIGWLLVISGWIGIYLAGAVVCNTVYGKPVFFVPKPLVK